MASPYIQELINLWRSGSQSGKEISSVSDRLRPPYITPVPFARPANPRSALHLEQGFRALPAAYQKLIGEQTAEPIVDVGTRREGLANPGSYISPAPLVNRFYNPFLPGEKSSSSELPLRWMVGDSPRTLSHELIHALTERLGLLMNRETNEILAGAVSGAPSTGWEVGQSYAEAAEKAKNIDAYLTFLAIAPRWLIRTGEFGDAMSLFKAIGGGER